MVSSFLTLMVGDLVQVRDFGTVVVRNDQYPIGNDMKLTRSQ